MAISSGAWYTGSLFFVAIVRDFGWAYASTASIFSLFTVLYGAWGILIGHLVDRLGPRAVVLGGGLLLPLALLGSGSAHALWHFYATHSVLTALGLAATTYVPVSLVLTRRFHKQRGFAFGIASAGVGAGILLFVPLTQAIMSLWGWRVAYRALAVAAALVVLPVGFFALKEEPDGFESDGDSEASPPPIPEGAVFGGIVSFLVRREFWLVAATYVFFNGPIALLQTHQVAHLTQAGQPEMLVAGIVGLVGLFSIPGKIGWGFLSDRFWIEAIYLAGGMCLAGAVVILLAIDQSSAVWYLYAYSLLMGLSYAVSASMNPILAGRFFSGPHFGVILGTLNTFYQGGAAAAIWVAGYAHDLTGSYRAPLLAAAASVCVAATFVWAAAPRRMAR
jgi:MFS family permease